MRIGLSLCLFVIFTTLGTAQVQSLYLGTGLSTMRGETADLEPLKEEFGSNFNLRYFISPKKDERISFFMETEYANIILKRQFGTAPNSSYYQSNFSQAYLAAGLRFYFNNKINSYNPYLGMILPFVGLSAGAVSTTNHYELNDQTPTVSFKKPEAGPMEGIGLQEGTYYDFAAKVEGGVAMMIDRFWMLELFANARRGTADNWDGVIGNTNTKDWFVSGGIGIHYRF